jgi:hypothetical protein
MFGENYKIGKVFSVNDEVIIYPSEKGWIKIREIYTDIYADLYTKSLVRVDVDKHLRHKVTLDGGYKDQLWSIINDLNELFFIGSSYLESTRIELA